jgi:hypothetical protein
LLWALPLALAIALALALALAFALGSGSCSGSGSDWSHSGLRSPPFQVLLRTTLRMISSNGKETLAGESPLGWVGSKWKAQAPFAKMATGIRNKRKRCLTLLHVVIASAITFTRY